MIRCGTNYTAKQIQPVLLDAGGSEARLKDEFFRECCTLSRCLHPNIVQFIGIYYPMANNKAANIPTMVMELMDCNLCKFIEQNTIPLHMQCSVNIT